MIMKFILIENNSQIYVATFQVKIFSTIGTRENLIINFRHLLF